LICPAFFANFYKVRQAFQSNLRNGGIVESFRKMGCAEFQQLLSGDHAAISCEMSQVMEAHADECPSCSFMLTREAEKARQELEAERG